MFAITMYGYCLKDIFTMNIETIAKIVKFIA